MITDGEKDKNRWRRPSGNLKKRKGKIEEEIVMVRKRIRTGGNLQEGDGEDSDRGMERKKKRRR
jgi:hypothetical protein